MAAIRRGGSLSNTDSVTVRRVTIPAATLDGDIGILSITYQQPTAGAPPLDIPGWTRIGEVVVTDYRSAVYRKTLTVADRGVEVEVTFASSQRAPMALEVWGGLGAVPVTAWNTHTTATNTHLVDTVGTSGEYQPFAIFATRGGPTPPPDAVPPSGYTIRQFGVMPNTYSAVVGIASGPAGTAPVGGGSFNTLNPFTSVTWMLAFPVSVDVDTLRVHSMGVSALQIQSNHIRLYKASVGATITPYAVRRNGRWAPLSLNVRRGGTWV